MERITSGQRQRTCRACGKKYDYPDKGSHATRHHCENCVHLPPDTLKTLERLSTRLTQMEHQLRSLQAKVSPPAKAPVATPAPVTATTAA